MVYEGIIISKDFVTNQVPFRQSYWMADSLLDFLLDSLAIPCYCGNHEK